jgi:hypothetical protein
MGLTQGALASDRTDVLAKMQQSINGFNTNDTAAMAANLMPFLVIVDDLPPFHFQGPNAPCHRPPSQQAPDGLVPGKRRGPGFDDTCLFNEASSETFVRLSDAHLHEFSLALLLQRPLPRLFTAAAWSGLRPAPECRSRGAVPHLSRSLSTRLLVHDELPFRVLLQHTVSQINRT